MRRLDKRGPPFGWHGQSHFCSLCFASAAWTASVCIWKIKNLHLLAPGSQSVYFFELNYHCLSCWRYLGFYLSFYVTTNRKYRPRVVKDNLRERKMKPRTMRRPFNTAEKLMGEGAKVCSERKNGTCIRDSWEPHLWMECMGCRYPKGALCSSPESA